MTCSFCEIPFKVVSRVRGFATIPAQRERIRCPRCGVELDVYVWWPPINGRRCCAILVKPRAFPVDGPPGRPSKSRGFSTHTSTEPALAR